MLILSRQFDNLTEHRGPIQLKVRGYIPSWVAGSLYRTGPGVSKVENVSGAPNGALHIRHWFDGLAHTHRFDIMSDPGNDNDNDGTGTGTGPTKVLYSSRRQCHDWIEHVQKNGTIDMLTFAQRSDPCVGIFGKIMSSWKAIQRERQPRSINNIGVTVQLSVPGLQSASSAAKHADTATKGSHRSNQTVWLGTDANMLREIDSETLEPLQFAAQSDLHPSLDGPFTCAHAERCPLTGDYFNINIKPGPVAIYRVFRVSAGSGQTEILAEFSRVDLPAAYLHSFCLSEHFVVLRVPSSHLKTYGLGVIWEKNILDAIVPFEEKNVCRWFVIDRLCGRGVVAEFTTAAGFHFHSVNCFEEPFGGDARGPGHKVNVFCDVIDYPTTNILHALSYDVMMNRDGKAKSAWGDPEKAENMLPRLARWKFTVSLPIPAEISQNSWSAWSWFPLSWLSNIFQLPVQPERPQPEEMLTIFSPHAGELPTINPAYHTRPYRYIYSLSMSCLSTLVDGIIRTDTKTRSVLRWNNPHGHTPGEAIFVTRPGATREDDGVLLSVVLDGVAGKSYLLCLDAGTMCEKGRAEMDFAVGFGFHGVHVTNAST